MSNFVVFETPIAGLKVVERKPIHDGRGFLSRIFCINQFRNIGFTKPIIQINQTLTKEKGVVRGMHFQNSPYEEMKLVSCLQGQVWDVAIDLRKNSPTFLQWHAEVLSSENSRALLIPEGFAHGFQTLSKDCELLYLHTNEYHPASEAGLNAKDCRLNINWPLDIADMSERDKSHPFIQENFQGVLL